MKVTRKHFSLRKNKVIGALAASLLVTTSLSTIAYASDTNIINAYSDIDVNVETNTIDIFEEMNEEKSDAVELVPQILISHAGGRVRGKSYTNSKESLDKSYKNGYRFIELDFEWTTDENLALIHDWEGYVNSAFGVESKKYSTEEFKSFEMIENLTQMTLEDLAEWLYAHEDAYIVTDIKTNNIEALKLIGDKYPDLVKQFIPQIYRIDQFTPVREIGYKNIILTLYASNYSDEELIDFVREYNFFAITMPITRAQTELPNKLKEENVFVYAHTINNQGLRQELELYGVDGFYTDDILPLSWGVDQIEMAKEYNLVTDDLTENLQQAITREELCKLIVKLYEAMSEDIALLPDTNKFTDTDNQEILKASALGVVNGVSETEFTPNANVTREAMATMIYRTLILIDESLAESDYSIRFADKSEISSWALEAVGFLNSYDILVGVGSNRVAPKDSVTREQSIILLKRTFEKFNLD